MIVHSSDEMPPLSSTTVKIPVWFPGSINVISAIASLPSASPAALPSPSLSLVLSKSQIYSKDPPSGSNELEASNIAFSPVLTYPGILIMIEWGELTNTLI